MVTQKQIDEAKKNVTDARKALDVAEQTHRDLCDLKESETRAAKTLTPMPTGSGKPPVPESRK
jgi:cellobiose-specific phosphotransferase system component IIA